MGIIRKINKDDENKIAGGLTYSHGNDRNKPYEVIDDVSGEVVLRCRSKSEAKNYAKLHNYGTTEIDWNNLKKLRDENK